MTGPMAGHVSSHVPELQYFRTPLMNASAALPTLPRLETEQEVETALPWSTIVWNDPINLMSYVTWVFMTYFGYDRAQAETLMWQVHTDGKACVSQGSRERMESDAAAMHSYGLWATIERSGD
ncbi:MAG: hypothetical protein RL745_512 [Actinomycetota bacterium]